MFRRILIRAPTYTSTGVVSFVPPFRGIASLLSWRPAPRPRGREPDDLRAVLRWLRTRHRIAEQPPLDSITDKDERPFFLGVDCEQRHDAKEKKKLALVGDR